MKKYAAVSAALSLLCAFTVSASALTYQPAPAETTAYTQTAEASYARQVTVLVNRHRARYGLQPLTLDSRLSRVAEVKAQDMSRRRYFSHNSPTYGTAFQMLKSFGISYRSAGENIAYGQRTPEAVVQAWMNSPSHRAAILNGNYTHLGLGYAANGHYWTLLLIGT